MKDRVTSSLSLGGLTVKCSNCAIDVDIAHMGEHVCQPRARQATPPPEEELEIQSKSTSDRPTPSTGFRQAEGYPPWSSKQHGARPDLFKQAISRLGPPPRIDPFAANKSFLRPDVLTPSSAKSFPQTPSSLLTSRHIPQSPGHHPYQRPPPSHAAAPSTPGNSAQSFTPYSPEAARFPVNEQQQSTPKGPNWAPSHLDADDHAILPRPPPVTPVTDGTMGTPFVTSSGFPADLVAPLSPQQRIGRPPSKEQVKHRREMSIDSKSMHSGNRYHSRGLTGSFHKDTVRQPADLATVPASPATSGMFRPIAADDDQPHGATGRSRGYSSSYGPPSPTSHYAPSHAPSESVYSTTTKFRLDDEFSVTNFARNIGLMGDDEGMCIDDDELDTRMGGVDSHPRLIYEEPQRMHHSTDSESTQGSHSSGFNARSVSTSATSTSGSQDYRAHGPAMKGAFNDECMDSPTDPFFAHGKLSNPDNHDCERMKGIATAKKDQQEAQNTSARSNHRTQTSSVSSVADRLKGSRRYSAGKYDKTSPIVTHFPKPPSSANSPVEGVPAFRRPSRTDDIAVLKTRGPTVSPKDASSSLEHGIRRLRGSECDSIATIPQNGGLPTPSPSAEKLSACHRISETQEPENDSRPGPMPRRETRQEARVEPESKSSDTVAVPPAHVDAPLSPTSSCKQRVRSICRGCNEYIVGKSVSSADGRLTGRWHRKCFRCSTCQEPFATGDFYVHDNKPYCAQHYHELNGSLCAACNKGIEGTYLETQGIKDEKSWETNGHSEQSQSTDASHHSRPSSQEKRRKNKFHPECFKCATCQVILRGDYFEWNGLPYCERDSRLAAGIIHSFTHSADHTLPRNNPWNHTTPDSGAWSQDAYPNYMQPPLPMPPHMQHYAAPADFRRPMPPQYQAQGYFGPPPPGYRRPSPAGPPVAPGPYGPMGPWGPPPARPPRPGYTPAVPYPPPATPGRLPPQRGLPPGSEPYGYGEMRGDFGHHPPNRAPYGRGPWVPGPNGPMLMPMPMAAGAAGPGMPYPPQRRFPERRTTKLTFI